MDRSLRDARLESLRRSLARLMEKRPTSPDALIDNYDLQDILSVNLERAVQTCVDLAAMVIADLGVTPPGTMAESFDILAQQKLISGETAARMKKAVGF